MSPRLIFLFVLLEYEEKKRKETYQLAVTLPVLYSTVVDSFVDQQEPHRMTKKRAETNLCKRTKLCQRKKEQQQTIGKSFSVKSKVTIISPLIVCKTFQTFV